MPKKTKQPHQTQQQNLSTFLIPKAKRKPTRKPTGRPSGRPPGTTPKTKAQKKPGKPKAEPQPQKPEIEAPYETHKPDQQPETHSATTTEVENCMVEGQTVINKSQSPAKTLLGRPPAPRQAKSHSHQNAFVGALIDGVEPAEILKIFAGLATNKEALAVLAPILPQLFRVIVSGSLIRGSTGSTDRATVMSMLGMPWSPGRRFAPGASDAGVRTPAARVQDWAERFERAMNGAMPAEARHTLGTLMGDDDEISAFSPEIEE